MGAYVIVGAIASAAASMASLWFARAWLHRRLRHGNFDKRWEVSAVAKKPHANTGQQVVG